MLEMITHQLLEESARKFPNVEIVSGNKRFTYVLLHERVLRLANRLAEMGVEKGTVVGVIDVNSHRYIELQYALSYLGAIIHPLNYMLPEQDLLFTIRHAQDEWLFVWSGMGELVSKLSTLVRHFIVMTDESFPNSGAFITYESIIEVGKPEVPICARQVTEKDICSIMYTTGTTGRPKGIRYRHRDLLLCAIQVAHHLALHRTGARLGWGDTIMPLVPFYHIHSWGASLFGPYIGAKIVLPEQADPMQQIELFLQERVNWSNMLPAQLHFLLEAATTVGKDIPLKVLTGGHTFLSGLAKRAVQAGVYYSLVYGGVDQLATSISGNSVHEFSMRSMPIPMVNTEIRDELGELVPEDATTIGELWVQSPWLPEGYVADEEQSQQTFRDGWFRTKDLAVSFPDGSIAIVDRKNDAIKGAGGEWIATSLIENVLSELPEVSMAAVIGIPDEALLERPCAILQVSDVITEDMVRRHMQGASQSGKLPESWLPSRYEFVSTMPLTSIGKIDKSLLRNQFRPA